MVLPRAKEWILQRALCVNWLSRFHMGWLPFVGFVGDGLVLAALGAVHADIAAMDIG